MPPSLFRHYAPSPTALRPPPPPGQCRRVPDCAACTAWHSVKRRPSYIFARVTEQASRSWLRASATLHAIAVIMRSRDAAAAAAFLRCAVDVMPLPCRRLPRCRHDIVVYAACHVRLASRLLLIFVSMPTRDMRNICAY